MPYRYTYNNQVYTSTSELRKAIWNTDHIIYGNPRTAEDFAKIDSLKDKVAVEEYTYESTLTVEQKASMARSKRDSLLRQSDFYVMPDYPSTPEGLEVVKQYRQALRDITSLDGFPEDITWPNVPVYILSQPEKTKQIQALSL